MSNGPGIYERRPYPKGAVIVRQGDPGDCAFLIQSGTVEVYTKKDGKDVSIAQLATGEIFGEMALLNDENRGAFVRAVEETTVIIIPRDIFHQKLGRSDPTMRALVQMLARRVTLSNQVMFGMQNDIKGLIETTQSAYENVCKTLPDDRQEAFKAAVQPKLREFLNAIRTIANHFKE